MKRYVIEREIPKVGANDEAGFRQIAVGSNAALARLAPDVQWEHSYVTGDKTFCIYLAEDEEAIREHAKLAGIPANRITPVVTIVDPTRAAA
jgi:hypothetical protein